MVQLEQSQIHHYLNKILFQYLISTSVLSMIQLYPWDSPYKRGTLKDTVLQKFTKVSHGGKCYNINECSIQWVHNETLSTGIRD